ncbi:MAG: hypothetical protein ACRD3Q_17400 [Terriglobales bacterium]
MAECLGCGCTDLQGCSNGCTWLALFEDDTGICSRCPELLERLQAEGRVEPDELVEDDAAGSGLILPGDPEFDSTLARRR